MKKLSLSAILLCSTILPAKSHSEEPMALSLVVNSPGTRPHLYFNEIERKYDGVIPDLLRFVQENSNYTIEFVDSHRNRNEFFVASGKFDMFYSSIDWVRQPDVFISTMPIFQHVSYMYSLKPFPEGFELNIDTKANVCARRGFIYPTLDPLFAQGNLKRIDSNSHYAMLKMLSLGRCNMVEMNAKNARAMFQDELFKEQVFYQSDKPTSKVPASLIMNAKLKAERDMLNKFIIKFKENGLYDQSLAKHLSSSAMSKM